MSVFNPHLFYQAALIVFFVCLVGHKSAATENPERGDMRYESSEAKGRSSGKKEIEVKVRQPMTPDMLLLHWAESMKSCIDAVPLSKTITGLQNKEAILSLRLFVARFLFADYLLQREFKNQPQYRKAYMLKVEQKLIEKMDVGLMARVVGKKFPVWFRETVKDMSPKFVFYVEEYRDKSVPQLLIMAACSFDANFSADEARQEKALLCFQADVRVMGRIFAAARMEN